MLDTIERAIEDIKAGKLVIVVDDEDRENEGDFITASESVTPEVINFMSKHGRGLICVALLEERCDELGLELMVNNNTALHETAFTVSVDLLGHGCTTGISAQDRAKTIRAAQRDQWSSGKNWVNPDIYFRSAQKKVACCAGQATQKQQ